MCGFQSGHVMLCFNTTKVKEHKNWNGTFIIELIL